MLSDFRYRLRALFSRAAVESEMDDEIRFHIEQQAAKYRARGIDPDAALRRARLEFGGAEQVREQCREARGTRLLEDVVHDVRYALRGFRQSPSFVAVAVLSLALGIGANTAIFSVVDALLLKPLPVRDAAGLAVLGVGRGANDATYGIWRGISQRQDVFSQTFAWSATDFDLASGGEKQPARGLYVTGDYFSALGVAAQVGRLIISADDLRGGPPVAVLSYDFWQSRYGGDPAIAGRFIRLDNHPFQVLGVAAPGFFGVDVGDRFDVAVPATAEAILHSERSWMDQQYSWWLTMGGRLRPGVDAARAEARLNILAPPIFQALFPQDKHNPSEPYFSVRPAAGGVSAIRERYRQALLLLMGMVGLVLLIACANLANLLLSRAGARSREVAVRLALGAGRARLVRQFLTESLLLSLGGAALGAVFARFAGRLLVAWISSSHQARYLDLSPDLRMIAFTSALAVLTGILFGLAPALRATRLAPQSALKEGTRGLIGSRHRLGLGRVLVVVQVALSLVLLIGAGLFVGSLRRIVSQDVGFRRDHVLLVDPDLRAARYSRERQSAVSADILARLSQLPGVQSASRSVVTPIGGSAWQWNVNVDDPGQATRKVHCYFNLVSPRFFQTMHTPLLAGRDFTDSDSADAPFVAIANQTAAGRLFSGRNPIGGIFEHAVTAGAAEHQVRVQVVGLAADAKYRRMRDAVPPTIYIPITQNPAPFQVNGIYELRFTGPLPDLTSRVKSIFRDADARIGLQFQLLSTQMDDSLLQERLVARLASFFGILALVLASIGVYGVVAYAAVRRRGEIGIRMALGATRGIVAWLVLRETAALLAIGIPLGLAGALACARLVRAMLFTLAPSDPPTLAAACLVLLLVAIAAGYLPARRAARLDPLAALREE